MWMLGICAVIHRAILARFPPPPPPTTPRVRVRSTAAGLLSLQEMDHDSDEEGGDGDGDEHEHGPDLEHQPKSPPLQHKPSLHTPGTSTTHSQPHVHTTRVKPHSGEKSHVMSLICHTRILQWSCSETFVTCIWCMLCMCGVLNDMIAPSPPTTPLQPAPIWSYCVMSFLYLLTRGLTNTSLSLINFSTLVSGTCILLSLELVHGRVSCAPLRTDTHTPTPPTHVVLCDDLVYWCTGWCGDPYLCLCVSRLFLNPVKSFLSWLVVASFYVNDIPDLIIHVLPLLYVD